MRKRSIQIPIRVNEKEFKKIQALSKKCGLSREEYLRSVAVGCELKQLPDADFFETVRLLRRCGENINQIAKKLNSGGNFNSKQYEENYKEIQEWINLMFDKFC